MLDATPGPRTLGLLKALQPPGRRAHWTATFKLVTAAGTVTGKLKFGYTYENQIFFFGKHVTITSPLRRYLARCSARDTNHDANHECPGG
jgi:hypothetical protein